MTLGSRIKHMRCEMGMTTQALADAAGISVSHIREIENDRKQPSLPVFRKLVVALQASSDELLEIYQVADVIRLNRITMRMQELPQEQQDMLCFVCEALLAQMKE